MYIVSILFSGSWQWIMACFTSFFKIVFVPWCVHAVVLSDTHENFSLKFGLDKIETQISQLHYCSDIEPVPRKHWINGIKSGILLWLLVRLIVMLESVIKHIQVEDFEKVRMDEESGISY